MKNTKIILALFTSLVLCTLFVSAASELFQPSPLELLISSASVFAVLFLTGREMVKRSGYSFMEACGLATASILYDCNTPLTGGTKTTVWLGNLSELEDYDVDVYNNIIVTNLILASGKTLFKLEGASGTNGSSARPSFQMVELAYQKAFEHDFSGLALDISPETKLELSKWVKSEVYIIYENKQKGVDGNSAFEILGLNAGLNMKEFKRDPNNKDTSGGFEIRFTTNENSREGTMPHTFWNTDYATTLQAINDLLA